MYFWRIEALKRQMITAPLGDRETLPYLIGDGVLTSVVGALPPMFPTGGDTLQGLGGVPLAIGGTIWVYRQNGGQTGSELLPRYLTLSWVLLVRFVPLISALFIIATVAIPSFDLEHTGPVSVILSAGTILLFYQRLGAHLRHVSQAVARSRSVVACDS